MSNIQHPTSYVLNDKHLRHNKKVEVTHRLEIDQSQTVDNFIDPIISVLLLALRSGNVANAKDIRDTLTQAARRKDQRIIWRDNTLPILAALEGAGRSVKFNQPANSNQLREFLLPLSVRAGVLAIIKPHDLRRGGVTEHVNAGSTSKEPQAGDARVVGHSRQSFQRGVTDSYYKPTELSRWRKRTELETPLEYHIGTSANPQKKRRVSKNEVDSKCEKLGLDPKSRNARAVAARKVRADNFKIWREIEENALKDDELLPSQGNPSVSKVLQSLDVNSPRNARKPKGQVLIEQENEFQEYELQENELQEYELQENELQEYELQENVPQENELQEYELQENDLILGLIDPRLLVADEESSALHAKVIDSELSLDVGCTTNWSRLNMPPLQFLEEFSTINTTCSSRFFYDYRGCRNYLTVELNGNSRNALEQFLYPCRNAKFGCPKTFPTRVLLNGHQPICKSISSETAGKLRDRSFKCSYPECVHLKGYFTKADLTAHICERHKEWIPRTCYRTSCDDNTLWETKYKYHVHLAKHSDIIPEIECAAIPCSLLKTFTSRQAYRLHLVSFHQLSKKEYQPFLAIAKANRAAGETTNEKTDLPV